MGVAGLLDWHDTVNHLLDGPVSDPRPHNFFDFAADHGLLWLRATAQGSGRNCPVLAQ